MNEDAVQIIYQALKQKARVVVKLTGGNSLAFDEVEFYRIVKWACNKAPPEVKVVYKKPEPASNPEEVGPSADADVVDALVGLGYSKSEAKQAAAGLKSETLEDKIKEALGRAGNAV